jgi:hypothetical protein
LVKLRLLEPAFETLGIAPPTEELGASLSLLLLTPFEYWLPAVLVNEKVDDTSRGTVVVVDRAEAELRMASEAEALADFVVPDAKGELRSAVEGIARRLVWPRVDGAAVSAASVFSKTGNVGLKNALRFSAIRNQ